MSLLLERPATTPTGHEPTRTPQSPHPAIVQPVEPWSCVYVTSIRHRRILAATAYDCVRFVVVRDGSIILTDADADADAGGSASVGDVVLVAPNVEFGYEPEGTVTVRTVAVDTDYWSSSCSGRTSTCSRTAKPHATSQLTCIPIRCRCCASENRRPNGSGRSSMNSPHSPAKTNRRAATSVRMRCCSRCSPPSRRWFVTRRWRCRR